MVKVPNRSSKATIVRRKAEDGNPNHVAAPMPGVISTLAVAAGQEVKAGDMLLSIEAMKMETAIHAERDGKIAEVLVKSGSQIDAKDLLLVYAA
jgi:pyruvate carboxylase